jgi:hypothetical protein
MRTVSLRESVVVLLLAISLGLNVVNHFEGRSTLSRVERDESNTKKSAAHTRAVQIAGEPVGVCLLEGIRAVLPTLEAVPGAKPPLTVYVALQSKRYTSTACPDGLPRYTPPKK